MYIATLLLVATTLVLNSGDRIRVEGDVSERNGVVIFRSGGALYSIPASMIDAQATKAANAIVDDSQPAPKRLKVSAAERDRLLKELEQNHSGQPAAEQRWENEPPSREPARVETLDTNAEEWNWRNRARAHEEAVRQAKENLDLLHDRAERLRSEITGLLSLGWKPKDFTYQTTQLEYVLAQIPYAELTVTRAQRAFDQFRDDARRQGVMPGWLR